MKFAPGIRCLNLACVFIIAAILYAASYYLLWQGYRTLPSPNSESASLQTDPLLLPLVAVGLAGIWLARAVPILPWVWIVALSFWTYWNVRYAFGGILLVDGRHGCVLCESSVLLLLIGTAGWLLVAFVVWLATRAKRFVA